MRCHETASQHPEFVKQTSTKTYTYTGIEHDIIKLAFSLRDVKAFQIPRTKME